MPQLRERAFAARRTLLRAVAGFIDGVFEGVAPRAFEVLVRVLGHISGRLPAKHPRDEAGPDAARVPEAPKG